MCGFLARFKGKEHFYINKAIIDGTRGGMESKALYEPLVITFKCKRKIIIFTITKNSILNVLPLA